LSIEQTKDVPLIVVMGVAGSGKSTIAAGLAEKLGVDFIEGDSLHPQANVNKMAGGVPLTDDDRWPWLDKIGAHIEAERQAGRGVVVSCSALKHIYRDRLRAQVKGRVQFVMLNGSRDLIAGRMLGRKGHFMPQSLLDSQLATLEKPGPDEDAVILDITHDVKTLLSEASAAVGA
jgi:gluconokinase